MEAVRRLLVVHEQDQCARQFHDYHVWSDGLRRCNCGAAHPDDYIAAASRKP
jgi:hypothetical protein